MCLTHQKLKIPKKRVQLLDTSYLSNCLVIGCRPIPVWYFFRLDSVPQLSVFALLNLDGDRPVGLLLDPGPEDGLLRRLPLELVVVGLIVVLLVAGVLPLLHLEGGKALLPPVKALRILNDVADLHEGDSA